MKNRVIKLSLIMSLVFSQVSSARQDNKDQLSSAIRFGYSKAALAAMGNSTSTLIARIKTGLALGNRANRNSYTGCYFGYGGIDLYPTYKDTDDYDIEEDQTAWRARSFDLAATGLTKAQTMYNNGADIAVFVAVGRIGPGDSSGLAVQGGNDATVNVERVHTFVLAHEIGHCYNATHEKGYVYKEGGINYSTLMAEDKGINQQYLDFYSGPKSTILVSQKILGDSTNYNNAVLMQSSALRIANTKIGKVINDYNYDYAFKSSQGFFVEALSNARPYHLYSNAKNISFNTRFIFGNTPNKTYNTYMWSRGSSKYVSSNNDSRSGPDLTADRTSRGDWENFQITYNKSSDKFYIKASNGKYITSNNGEHPLSANRTWASDWETWTLFHP